MAAFLNVWSLLRLIFSYLCWQCAITFLNQKMSFLINPFCLQKCMKGGSHVKYFHCKYTFQGNSVCFFLQQKLNGFREVCILSRIWRTTDVAVFTCTIFCLSHNGSLLILAFFLKSAKWPPVSQLNHTLQKLAAIGRICLRNRESLACRLAKENIGTYRPIEDVWTKEVWLRALVIGIKSWG